ncbi:response regulator transcription factor [Uliginosibacterium sediminicola]|uniref:Response regulator transcription factor n=1 Tax=Uliginosibacterium sediminicola TaxID=2024550 RepID=A0ABU9YUB5_9RHOO
MRILLVEDHPLLGDAVQVSLRQAGYSVDWVQDGVAADSALCSEEFAALVLDLGLPRRSGLEVLQGLRSRGACIPVIILTARDSVDDRIRGLDCGADDYLVKPFDMGELAARLRALLRRSAGGASAALHAGSVCLDPATRSVTQGGQEVSLSAREFSRLHALLLNAGRVMSKAQLEQQLYAWGDEVESNTIEVFVHHLRRKLGAGCIRTIRGVGYLLPRDTAATDSHA